MTSTSDERREVAARLRMYPLESVKADHKGKDPLQLPADVMYDLMDIAGVGEDFDSLLPALADLIEPEPEKTCHIKPDEKASEECCGPMLSCDACGTWIPPINGPYRYCPYCGARVVDGGDA